MPDSERERQFLHAEHLVDLHSAELKKELRPGDLVLSQILYITGLAWKDAASFTIKVSGVVLGINAVYFGAPIRSGVH